MGEHASTMKELLSLVVLAQNSLLVNAVKMILVNFIHAKIMGLVSSSLLMAKKPKLATVQKILMDQIVISCFAVGMTTYLVIIAVHANSMEVISSLTMSVTMSLTYPWTCCLTCISEGIKDVNVFKRTE